MQFLTVDEIATIRQAANAINVLLLDSPGEPLTNQNTFNLIENAKLQLTSAWKDSSRRRYIERTKGAAA